MCTCAWVEREKKIIYVLCKRQRVVERKDKESEGEEGRVRERERGEEGERHTERLRGKVHGTLCIIDKQRE